VVRLLFADRGHAVFGEQTAIIAIIVLARRRLAYHLGMQPACEHAWRRLAKWLYGNGFA
jgi:hypothetical protein